MSHIVKIFTLIVFSFDQNEISRFVFLFSVSDIEVRELERTYFHLSSSVNRQIGLETFLNTLTPVLPPILIPGVFDAFDENRDSKIESNRRKILDLSRFQIVSILKNLFVESVRLVVVPTSNDTNVCRSLNFFFNFESNVFSVLFRVFDRDRDGILNRSDIIHMCSCLIDSAQYVYAFGLQMIDSPDVYAEQILQSFHSEVRHFSLLFISNRFVNE